MDERSARDVVLVRAIETTDTARQTWTDDDRAWALRTTGEILGERAPTEVFLARRAELVLERLRGRFPRLAALGAIRPGRAWIGLVVALGAFVIGLAGADVGPAHAINLLAPPVLALLAWNLGVYALLAAHAAVRRRSAESGPLRRMIVHGMRDVARASRAKLAPAPLAVALQRFASDWAVLATPLWRQRAARLLHSGAAALAIGMIAGLYLRGIALEYRASWQSTFLDAADVAHILRVVLAPGAWLTGIRVPDAPQLEALAAQGGGENAARWIHLYAATILLVVTVPRLVLAAIAGLRERRLRTHFPLAFDTPYFARLVRAWREGRLAVLVVAYSFDVPAASREGLVRLLERTHEAGVDVEWAPTVAYGEDVHRSLDAGAHAAVVALFNATATSEREAQGAFVETLQRMIGSTALVAIVDTSPFVERFGDDARRLAERERAWRSVLEASGVEPLFLRLAAPDVTRADAELAERLERAA
ncbi:MAG TPA: DUF2868 domain-containing protein [Casimicrobiaceae bacterium]|nr:DUF2868 domain-containing protein [Casimicrobiaceae bacterium]